ncbi:MAG: GTP pyrophosphokinase, partial [Muribaculum sp.]|nr:GTP pyrophosphokinase [Muribaculum sp.]
VNENEEIELHQLSCPRASILKASYGPRIIAVEWGNIQTTFRAEIHIEGIDRRGILQEIIQMISKQMSIDIRRLNIGAEEEVFTSSLVVKVNDSRVVSDLCNKLKKINGVKSASRVN